MKKLAPRQLAPAPDHAEQVNPETLIHTRTRGATWWGSPLPWIERADGQAPHLADAGWWTQPRLAALSLWLELGYVRHLAGLVTGTPEDREKHVRQSVEASLAVRGGDSQAIPERIRAGVYRMDQLAQIVDPGDGRTARVVWSRRTVVERAIALRLLPTHADPRQQVPTKTRDEDGQERTVYETLLPEVRQVIDHEARMRDADEAFR